MFDILQPLGQEVSIMKFRMKKGFVEINQDVFHLIAGAAATNCFGVRGMAARNMADGLVHLLKRDAIKKGVSVTFEDNQLVVELHIIVEHGVNISTIANSIIGEVSYVLESMTGVKVKAVNVCVDGIMVD